MIRVVYAVALMEDEKREMEKIGNENRMEQWQHGLEKIGNGE